MNALLPDVIAAEPVERKFGKAQKAGQFKSHDYNGQLAEAEQAGVHHRQRGGPAQAGARGRVRVHLGGRFRPDELRSPWSATDASKGLADAA